jgi:hypothetical protein
MSEEAQTGEEGVQLQRFESPARKVEFRGQYTAADFEEVDLVGQEVQDVAVDPEKTSEPDGVKKPAGKPRKKAETDPAAAAARKAEKRQISKILGLMHQNNQTVVLVMFEDSKQKEVVTLPIMHRSYRKELLEFYEQHVRIVEATKEQIAEAGINL